MIVLNGENFFLKTMTPADVSKDYISWLNDEKINQFLEVRHNIPSMEEAVSFVNKYNNKSNFMFAICEIKSTKMIGTITLNLDVHNKSASYGYLIGDKLFWGTKAAVEAISLLLDFAFFELDLRRVWGGAYIHNIGSIFNFKKLGFVQEGRQRAVGLINGKEIDSLLFGLLKSEWIKRSQGKGVKQ